MEGTLRKTFSTTKEPYEGYRTQNKIDTRQRVYNKLDSSQINGDWVEEPAFNRTQKNHGVLSGNWVEERILNEEKERLFQEGKLNTTAVHGPGDERDKKFRTMNSAVFAKDIGGQTTGLLIDAPVKHPSHKNEQTYVMAHGDVAPNQHLLVTTNQQMFKNHTQNIKSVGLRQQMIERQLHMQVLEEKGRELEREEEDFKTALNFSSTYKSDHCKNEQQPIYLEETILEKGLSGVSYASDQTSYLRDAPITIYSDAVRNRDDTLKTQIYHSAVTSRNPFAKNTDFSTPITQYNKQVTKD